MSMSNGKKVTSTRALIHFIYSLTVLSLCQFCSLNNLRAHTVILFIVVVTAPVIVAFVLVLCVVAVCVYVYVRAGPFVYLLIKSSLFPYFLCSFSRCARATHS